MPPQNNLAPVGLTKQEFNQRYWFTSLQMVTVKNLKATDYPFTCEMRHYIVRAGATEDFVGSIANVYLSNMSRIMAQDEEKLEFMSDPSFMAMMYDRLIEKIKNLAPQYDPTPTWQQAVQQQAAATPPWMQASQPQQPQQAPATPPWQQPAEEQAPLPAPNMERSTQVAQTVPPLAQQYAPAPEAPKGPEESSKEFELHGAKYRTVTTKNGDMVYFKDGKRTSAADYSKAASML